MNNKYKVLIQYSSVLYERLIINIFRYISDIETEFVGDMYISSIDGDLMKASKDSIIIASTHSKGDPFNQKEKDFFIKYMKNLYNELVSIDMHGNAIFTAIEIVEIKEE